MSTIKVIQNAQRVTKDGSAPLYVAFYIGQEPTASSFVAHMLSEIKKKSCPTNETGWATL